MRQQVITLVLGEVPEGLRGERFLPQVVKSAPPYARSLPRQVVIGTEHAEVAGRRVTFELRGYPPGVLLIQARTDVDDIFHREIFDLEAELNERAHEFLASRGGNPALSEGYTVFFVSGYEGPPEGFLRHAPIIASLLKSERFELDDREVAYTLRSQIKYAKNDLAILDWDGAFLFDPDGDNEEDLELLTLANLQLLRHRMLDGQLDDRLARIAGLVHRRPDGRPIFSQRDLRQDLREIVESRMASIVELQRLEREVKLFGDWYSARFYELALSKFKIDEWRRSIGSKLDLLEDVFGIVAENFSVSTKHRAEWIQIIFFFILQIGWFGLLVIEFFRYMRGT